VLQSAPPEYVYTNQNGNNIRGFSNIDLNPNAAAIPIFLTCTTATMNLNGKRNVEISY